MAPQDTPGPQEGAAPATGAPKVRARKAVPGQVRYFRKPEVKLIRMGREVAVFTAEWGTFDVANWRLEFRDATAKVETSELNARKISLDMPANRLTARGKVRLEEAGVVLSGPALTSVPSLSRLTFVGKPRLEADDTQVAAAVLGARGL